MIRFMGYVAASVFLGFCQPTIVNSDGINDYTSGVVLPLLEELYTEDEIKSGSPLTINWMDESLTYSAFVPPNPGHYRECQNTQWCMLFNVNWWTNSGWGDQPSANRVLVAHEFAHVLSLQRKLSDDDYTNHVNNVDEECLADAVAAIVLEREGFRPAVTDDYNVAYQCETFWIETYGESRAKYARDLAVDLLHWAEHRFDGPDIYTPAIATNIATRVGVEE